MAESTSLLSATNSLAPEVSEIVRAALKDVMINQPENPIRYLATRLRELNLQRKVDEIAEDTREHLKQQFEDADEDGSGIIGLDEYTAIRRRLMRHADVIEGDDVIANDFRVIDVNGSGGISFNEFLHSYVSFSGST